MARPEEPDGILYALYPGFVKSQHDGDHHYIGARQLAHLYGVPLRQCIVFEPNRFTAFAWSEYYLPLRPRSDGNYDIARVIQEMTWEQPCFVKHV